MINEKKIKLDHELTIEDEGMVTLHYTYEHDLTLKELSELLSLTNMSINDFNRDNGIKNIRVLGKNYASQVSAVREGSIIVDVLISVAVSLTTGLLANYLYDRLKTFGLSEKKKKEQRENNCTDELLNCPITISVNGKNINIHINNAE